MLLQLTVTNYKNFKNTAVLDLTEAKITEFPQHLLTNSADTMSVLPMAAVYGPNGSGKSNLLQALAHIQELVLNAPSAMAKDCSFAFDDASADAPTEYEILFRTNDREYDYQLKLLKGRVLEENLFGRTFDQSTFDVLCDRDSEGVFLCPAWEDTDVKALNDQTPLLYFLGQNKTEASLTRLLDVFRNVIILTGTAQDEAFLTSVLENPAQKQDLLAYLPSFDLSVTDFSKSEDGFTVTETKNGFSLTSTWSQVSTGTQRLLVVLSALLLGRSTGSLILADNPEIGLHPKAFGRLIRLAADSSSNPLGSQLLMTTNENSTMNNSLFRRDELWLVSPSPDGSSSLYTLALLRKENGEKVRKDETYFKQYLEGRYGASPQIEN